MATLDDPSRGLRTSAAMALADAGVASALPELEQRLAKSKDLSRMALERAVRMLKEKLKKPEGKPEGPDALALERQAADLELQAKELRNQAEAIKLKAERARLEADKPKSDPAAAGSAGEDDDDDN